MPDWLKQVHGMKPRSATEPYQDYCRSWMHQHIEHVRPFFAANGGPIIMTQIENELGGSSNTPYVKWLGRLASELKTGSRLHRNPLLERVHQHTRGRFTVSFAKGNGYAV